MSGKKLTVDAELEKLQRETFGYFLHETNPANGLVIAKTAAGWPANVAATGLALGVHPHCRCDVRVYDRAGITGSAQSHGVCVNTGAKPPPGVRKFVVCP